MTEKKKAQLRLIQQKRIGMKHSPETIAKLRSFRHTDESKEKMRQLKLGRKLTPEHKAKISAAQQILRSGFKGGRIKHSAGYIEILIPGHRYAHHGYVLEHRLVMERYLGRVLEPNEVVHHINGDKQDNRIENLMLFENNQAHMKYHRENGK